MRHPEATKSTKRHQRRHQAAKHAERQSYIEARRDREER